MLDMLNILVFVWLAFWALRAGKLIASGVQNSILIIMLVHFAFSGVPLLLDILFGPPSYLVYPGFYLSASDPTTRLIYLGYVSLVPLIWWWVGRRGPSVRLPLARFELANESWAFLRRFRPILGFMLISPLLALVAAPTPESYLNYGAIIQDKLALAESNSYAIIQLATFFSVIGAAGLLAAQPRIRLPFCLFIAPWMFLDVWLNGKRTIVPLILLLFLYVFWQKGYLRGKRLLLASLAGLTLLGVFSLVYQATFRNEGPIAGSNNEFYENIRIDYGRDHEIQMAIYAELHPDEIHILDYRGESVLFDLSIYVPRDLWPDKPLPYAQYVTSAMFLAPPRLWGWGMTTSWLDEAIANFGWLGLLLGPLVLAVICRLGDATQNALVLGLTILVGALLLTVQLPAFMPIFLLWLALVIWTLASKKKVAGVAPAVYATN